jgi:transposase
MMGRQTADQAQLFYQFHIEERLPADHLLRCIEVFAAAAVADLHLELADHYSHTGRPSIDPELLVRMLIVGYCYGIRFCPRLSEMGSTGSSG